MRLKIGTRKSQLALDQTAWVTKKIQSVYPDTEIETVKIETKGDQLIDVSLSKAGGKGLFLKEIQSALLEGEIDLAVHSMKDIPTDNDHRLEICAVTERFDPRDVLVSERGKSLKELPTGATIGTSSLRRASQLKAFRKDLQVIPIRGNINTRLQKLKSISELDGIILAKAGLARSGLMDQITQELPPDLLIPCPGQGALGLEITKSRSDLKQILTVLDHPTTHLRILAERSFLNKLGGSCHVPVGAYAEITEGMLILTGIVASLDGEQVITNSKTVAVNPEDFVSSSVIENIGYYKRTATQLGRELAFDLLEKGAEQVLREAQEVE